MQQLVRALNNSGIDRFREHLQALREGGRPAAPKDILFEDEYSLELPEKALVEETEFASRIDAMEYLARPLGSLGKSQREYFQGLWAWLSLFYFDQVCPHATGGIRKPGKDYRHIPDSSYRYRHRHLLAGPYQVFKLHGGKAHLLLNTPLYVESSFHQQIASRPTFITNPGILDAATQLYFDVKKNCVKQGAQSPQKPGALVRFVDVIQQLDLTFDLYSLTGDNILELLPKEFNGWRP
jgi:hypothetical protein